MPLNIIILVEIHLTSSCRHLALSFLMFLSMLYMLSFTHNSIFFGSLITSNLNFLTQIYSAALCQVSFPVHTSWRLRKQLPEEALAVPCSPCCAQPCTAPCRWAGPRQCLPHLGVLPCPSPHSWISTASLTQLSAHCRHSSSAMQVLHRILVRQLV